MTSSRDCIEEIRDVINQIEFYVELQTVDTADSEKIERRYEQDIERAISRLVDLRLEGKLNEKAIEQWQGAPADAHEEVGILLRKVVSMDIDNHQDLPGEVLRVSDQAITLACRATCPGHDAWMNSTQLPSGSSTMPITTPGRTSRRGHTTL